MFFQLCDEVLCGGFVPSAKTEDGLKASDVKDLERFDAWSVCSRTVARKSSIGGVTFVEGA